MRNKRLKVERAAEAHGVEKEKWSVILAPQLTGKAQ